MAIVNRSNSVTVADIAARNAIGVKVNGMEVTVLDASADSNAISPATYIWKASTTEWIITSGSKILPSNDPNLDTIQEIVDYVKSIDNGQTIVGWKDNISPLTNSASGDPANMPLLLDIGNGIWGSCYSNNKDNIAYADFHINHDYALGTNIFPHVHWLPLSYSLGTVRWRLDYIIAKGHNQSESLTTATSTIIIEAPGKGLIGEHMVSECAAIDAFTVPEPDTVIRMRLMREATHANDTFYGCAAAFFVDLHYQSNRDHSPNKAPDFYA